MSTESPFATPSPTQPAVTTSNTKTILLVVLGGLFLMALMCGGVLIALLLPAVSAARQAARAMQVSNQMKQIGLSFHNYHSAYNQLPPAVTTNSLGQPLQSWRVTLLPFLDDARSDRWNQDEAWDSAANTTLHRPTPSVYSSPFDDESDTGQTHVFTIRHPDGLMPGNDVIKFKDAPDGLANILLAVYLPDRTVNWAEPQDITLGEVQAELATASPQNRSIILMADGSVHMLSKPIDPPMVEAMVTRNGGESISF